MYRVSPFGASHGDRHVGSRRSIAELFRK